MKTIICGVLAGLYLMPAFVVDVNKTDAEFVDHASGNSWGWYLEENENYRENEEVVLVMHDNGTKENITDDVIIMVQKGVRNNGQA